jgi:hypothetical protein
MSHVHAIRTTTPNNLADPRGTAWMNASQLPVKEKKKKNMPFPFLPPGMIITPAKATKPQKVEDGHADIWHVD